MTDYAEPVQSLGDKPPAAITKRDRARFLTHELKASVRGLLHHDNEQESFAKDSIFEDTAFDPQKALRPEEKDESSIKRRLSLSARTVANAIKNPKAVGRNNYTRHAVAKIANHPHDQSTKFDDELLDAHDALNNAQDKYDVANRNSAVTPLKSTHAVEVVDARSRVQRIEAQRDNLKSGWVLGRHVVRAKAVRFTTSPQPERAQFYNEPVALGEPPRLQVGRYLGHMVLWYTAPFTAYRIDDFDKPPFDLRELALTVERLAAVSTPWQTFASKVRQVYRWDDPTRTTQIMFVYWVLWYFRCLMPFGVGYIIYITLRNKIYPTTVQAVRDRVKRSQDQSAKVQAWGELIQKHGGSDWVEPLLDGIGPHIQLQLSDLTIYLERMQNFYRWEQPRNTWLTLGLFTTMFLFLMLASTQMCLDLLWLALGCCFFYGLPIATHYPKYRHVVSPASWLFWVVPEAAELAISQLQEKVATRDDIRVQALQGERKDVLRQATQNLNAVSDSSLKTTSSGIETLPSDVETEEVTDLLNEIRSSDRLRFKTSLLPSHLAGDIILSRTHISFEVKERKIFSYPYAAILEIFKVDLNKDTDQNSTSDGRNKLSRMTHMSKSLEKSENIQVLPDGLGFIFQQEYMSEFEHSVTNSQTSGPQEPPQIYANATDTSPARDPRTIPLANPSDLSRTRDLDAARKLPAELEADDKKGVTLILNKSDRDKIFAVVLAWSNMRWQPLYAMNRQNKLGTRQKGTDMKETAGGGKAMNGNLDDAIKRALL